MQICQIWKSLLIDVRYVNTPEYSISTVFNYITLFCALAVYLVKQMCKWMSREHCPDLHARCRSPKIWNHIRNSECVTLNPLFFFRFKDRNWSVAAQTAQTKNKHRKAKEAQKKDPKDPTEHSKDSTLKNIFSRIEIKTGGPLNFGPSNILYIYHIFVSMLSLCGYPATYRCACPQTARV